METCKDFRENSWKRDLCTNCQRSRAEHHSVALDIHSRSSAGGTPASEELLDYLPVTRGLGKEVEKKKNEGVIQWLPQHTPDAGSKDRTPKKSQSTLGPKTACSFDPGTQQLQTAIAGNGLYDCIDLITPDAHVCTLDPVVAANEHSKNNGGNNSNGRHQPKTFNSPVATNSTCGGSSLQRQKLLLESASACEETAFTGAQRVPLARGAGSAQPSASAGATRSSFVPRGAPRHVVISRGASAPMARLTYSPPPPPPYLTLLADLKHAAAKGDSLTASIQPETRAHKGELLSPDNAEHVYAEIRDHVSAPSSPSCRSVTGRAQQALGWRQAAAEGVLPKESADQRQGKPRMALFKSIFKKGKKDPVATKVDDPYLCEWVTQTSSPSQENSVEAVGAMRGIWPHDPKATFQKTVADDGERSVDAAVNADVLSIAESSRSKVSSGVREGRADQHRQQTAPSVQTETRAGPAVSKPTDPPPPPPAVDQPDGVYDAPWGDPQATIQTMVSSVKKGSPASTITRPLSTTAVTKVVRRAHTDIEMDTDTDQRSSIGGRLNTIKSEGYLDPRRISSGHSSDSTSRERHAHTQSMSGYTNLSTSKRSAAVNCSAQQRGSAKPTSLSREAATANVKSGNMTEDDSGYYSENKTLLPTGRAKGGSTSQNQTAVSANTPGRPKGSVMDLSGAAKTLTAAKNGVQSGRADRMPETPTECFFRMSTVIVDTLQKQCTEGKDCGVGTKVVATLGDKNKCWDDFCIVDDAPLHSNKYCIFYKATPNDNPNLQLLLMVSLKEPRTLLTARNRHVLPSQPWFAVDVPTRLIPSAFLAANQPTSGLHSSPPVAHCSSVSDTADAQTATTVSAARPSTAGDQPVATAAGNSSEKRAAGQEEQDSVVGPPASQYDKPWHDATKSVVKSLETSYHAGLLNTGKFLADTLKCYAVVLPADAEALPMNLLIQRQASLGPCVESRQRESSELIFQVLLQTVKAVSSLFDCNVICVSLKPEDVLLMRKQESCYTVAFAPANLRRIDAGSGFIVCSQLGKLFADVGLLDISIRDITGFSRLEKLIHNANDMGDIKAIVKVWETVAWGPNEKEVRSLCMADDREGAFEMWLQMQRLQQLCLLAGRTGEALLEPSRSRMQLDRVLFLCSVTGAQLFAVSKLLHTSSS